MAYTITNVADLKPGDMILGLGDGHGGLIDVTGTVVHAWRGLLVLANPGQRDRHVATCASMRFHVA